MSAITTLLVVVSQDVHVNGNSADFDTSLFETLLLDVNLTELTGGVNPTVQFYLDRKTADGQYHQFLSINAMNGVSEQNTDVGPGLANNRVPGTTCRLRWIASGGPATALANVTVMGRL